MDDFIRCPDHRSDRRPGRTLRGCGEQKERTYGKSAGGRDGTGVFPREYPPQRGNGDLRKPQRQHERGHHKSGEGEQGGLRYRDSSVRADGNGHGSDENTGRRNKIPAVADGSGGRGTAPAGD